MKCAAIARCLILSVLTGCGGRAQPTQPQDVTVETAVRIGNLAYSWDRPTEAATQYQQAFKRAQAGDDAGAIGDYGYDLAVAQLAANQPKTALATARLTRGELARRGRAPFPALTLVEATALYRLGAREQANNMAAYVEAGYDREAAAQASFLRGLIADEVGNRAGLEAALERLAHPTSSEQRADFLELSARRDLRDGKLKAAVGQADGAADLRRAELDYRGMARALALEGAAAARDGETGAAANLYIRAAQSAAARGDAQTARPWVHRALALANSPDQRRLARQTLAGLASVPQ